MAAWPDVDELKALLDVTGNDFDSHLTDVLEAGIALVKADVGSWDEDEDEPDEALHNAALRAAILIRPNTTEMAVGGTRKDVKNDPSYQSLMFGHRRRFGVA